MAKYLVTVKAQVEEGDTGKLKNMSFKYLVDGAVSVSDAETQVEAYHENQGIRYDYEIVKSEKTLIDDLIDASGNPK